MTLVFVLQGTWSDDAEHRAGFASPWCLCCRELGLMIQFVLQGTRSDDSVCVAGN